VNKLDYRGVQFPAGAEREFYFLHNVRIDFGVDAASYPMVFGLFPGGWGRLGFAEIKNATSYTSTPPYVDKK
jgi:hypothetical protein